ncbi:MULTISPECIES: sensor histidine kinase [Algoriphagus]|uniref:sensor histidine kinase n=1 Tax=Algoriphagus TaxID=246875 RepID=UPI00119D1238|nr:MULTISPECIES: ATP-binding protein [Algoriphagus]
MESKGILALAVGLSILFTAFVMMAIGIVVAARKRLNNYYLEREQLLAANLEEGERTMSQIAKEVHDNIGQLTYLLNMTIQRARKVTNEVEREQLLFSAGQLSEKVLFYTHNISNSLNSEYIKRHGLYFKIQEDIEHIRNSGEIEVNLDITGSGKPADPNKELVVYRIAQEAVHNILKHASAKRIDISLHVSLVEFTLIIRDNGKGFELNEALALERNGLKNMMSRANSLKGELQIITHMGEGCEILFNTRELNIQPTKKLKSPMT